MTSNAASDATSRPAPTRVRDDSFPMRGWGLPESGELDRVVIVSPHLDDAVLSCARFMAVHPGVTVTPQTVTMGNDAAAATAQAAPAKPQ